MHAVQQGSMATTTPHRARPLGPLDPRSPAPWWGWTSQPLVRDEPAGGWIHDRTAEARLVGQRHGWSAGAAERVIAETHGSHHRPDRPRRVARDDVKAALAPLNDLSEGGPA
jgi:hypothetical protein